MSSGCYRWRAHRQYRIITWSWSKLVYIMDNDICNVNLCSSVRKTRENSIKMSCGIRLRSQRYLFVTSRNGQDHSILSISISLHNISGRLSISKRCFRVCRCYRSRVIKRQQNRTILLTWNCWNDFYRYSCRNIVLHQSRKSVNWSWDINNSTVSRWNNHVLL